MEFADVLVLGSGFDGSLLAMILAKQGRQVAVVDVEEHPRFALGESTTPFSNLTLKQIASTYDLPELNALTSYGSLREQLPGLRCGRKRGATYFGFDDVAAHADLSAIRTLLLSASESDYLSDTFWMRSDVDQFFLLVAMSYGVKFCLGCDYQVFQTGKRWQLTGTAMDQQIQVSAEFLVDATGAVGKVFDVLNVPQQVHVLKTNSSAVYGHFRGLKRVGAMLHDAGVNQSAHPFPCDDAAVHHVLEQGWMWQFPFDDGTTSVGMMWDGRNGSDETGIGEEVLEGGEANKRLMGVVQASDLLKEQFERAEIVRPEQGLVSTGRLQRLTSRAAGSTWAALPCTAGSIDPLLGTEIAHSLFGVCRLADILLNCLGPSRAASLTNYSIAVIDQFLWIDELVECCYQARSNFRLWCDAVLLQSCVVMYQEVGLASSGQVLKQGFLGADDLALREVFQEARQRIGSLSTCSVTSDEMKQWRAWLRSSMANWNQVGLFQDDEDFMYSSTAVSDQVRKA